MIIEYHRPISLEEALSLLMRETPRTIPLGGGGGISRGCKEPVAVVDLQDLGLDTIEKEKNNFKFGANVRLQSLVELGDLPVELREVIEYEFTLNARNSASLAGTIVRSTGRSSFTAALLALDSQMVWEPGGIEVPLGDWLPLRSSWRKRRLISQVKIKYPTRFLFKKISKTPMHPPEVMVCLAKWSTGRTRLVIGGIGEHPICVFDGTESVGLFEVASNACSQLFNSNTKFIYQQEMVRLLTTRLLSEV